MPGNTLFDPKEVEDFIENGGVSHNTKLARDRAVGHFLNFVKTDFSIICGKTNEMNCTLFTYEFMNSWF